MADDCLFCKIIAGQIPGRKVIEDDFLFAFEDISPQAPTHVLICPKRHIATTNELAAGDGELVGRLVLAARDIAAARGMTDYRLVLNCNRGAGQSVFHVHLHLLAGRDFTWPPG